MKLIVSGGIGNQMFQYALYLALKEKGVNIRLDTSLYFHVKMHNGYELKRCFGLNDSVINGDRLHILLLRALLKIRPKKLVFQDTLLYDETVFSAKQHYISGYWQSEKYFLQQSDLIRKCFTFKNIDSQNQDLAKEITNQNSISLHIRRGDYIDNATYSGICTTEYYKNAIAKIIDLIHLKGSIKFYLFSDDKDFAVEFIEKTNYPMQLIDFNKGEDSYKDMFLMSQCKHNIIANSSFSWWGAWLNNNPQKIVIAPIQWFNNTSKTYNDIVPDNWIKI